MVLWVVRPADMEIALRSQPHNGITRVARVLRYIVWSGPGSTDRSGRIIDIVVPQSIVVPNNVDSTVRQTDDIRLGGSPGSIGDIDAGRPSRGSHRAIVDLPIPRRVVVPNNVEPIRGIKT